MIVACVLAISCFWIWNLGLFLSMILYNNA